MKIIYTMSMVVRHVRIWLLGDSRWRGKDLWQVWCKECGSSCDDWRTADG